MMVTPVDPRTSRKLLQETSYPSHETIAPSSILSLVDQRRLPPLSSFVIPIGGQGSVFDDPVTWEDAEWQ